MTVRGWMIFLSIVGIIYGALVSLMQKDMKKLVAYSSVSHLGFCTLGIFALTPLGLSGSVLQQINHGISTGALFLIVGILYERRHTREIAEYGGISNVMPVYATITMIMFLSSMGLPLLNGFIGEFNIMQGTFMEKWQWAAWAVPGVVLAAAYLLWLYQRVFFGTVTNPKNEKLHDLTPREVATFVPLIIMAFWIGLYPKPFLQILEQPVNHTIAIVRPDVSANPAAVNATAQPPADAWRPAPAPAMMPSATPARGHDEKEGDELVAWTDYLLALPITLLTLFALGILLIDLMLPKEMKWANAVTAFVGVVFSAAGVYKIQLWMQAMGMPPGRGVGGLMGTVFIDRSPLYFFSLFLAGTAISILMSVRYLETEHENHGEYYALMLLSVVGMMCMAAGFRRSAHLHRPGIDGDLHLRAGRIPAPRPALERSRAEIFAARRVLLRHLRLRIVVVLWSDWQHESGGHRARCCAVRCCTTSTSRSPSSRCSRPLPDCCSRSRRFPSTSGRLMRTKARPQAITGFMSVAVKAAGWAMLLRILVGGLMPDAPDLAAAAGLRLDRDHDRSQLRRAHADQHETPAGVFLDRSRRLHVARPDRRHGHRSLTPTASKAS